MSLKTRLKSALHSFLNPRIIPPVIIQHQAPEPPVVLANQLLAGKNVLITGAGKNIGKSIALEMAKQGANIFFTDIDRARCDRLERELTTYPIQSKGFVVDITSNTDTDSLYGLLMQDNTCIDILVNNVGIQFTEIGLNNLKLSEWHKTFNTNVFGPIYLTKLITQMMIENTRHGSILFITSMHEDTVSRWSSYSASKAALNMIIKELAIDLAPHQIRVNGIAPGWVAEDDQGNPLYHDYTPLYSSSIAPRYIGRAAVYLASDYFSKFTTGTVLRVDGGLSLCSYRVAQHPPRKND